ncbi:S8 family serine peptidase [Natronococcus jeotgali]|uniref:S8 family serine peptidase n=1 Tax=Natronococcus jeotgali TaxID=413812 RepID=UPI0014613CFC|nr:S8 family serine peptidase [Natronococcus jeotgali]
MDTQIDSISPATVGTEFYSLLDAVDSEFIADDFEIGTHTPLLRGSPGRIHRTHGRTTARGAGWDEVRFVSANRDLEYFNDDSRETTGADRVHEGEDLETAYTGENVHTAVIDTGVDGAHPDLEGNLAANWQWVGDPPEQDVLWEDLGPVNTDDNGHGTHCCGTVGGDGTESDGEYKGIAPDATLTSYSANLSLMLVTSSSRSSPCTTT